MTLKNQQQSKPKIYIGNDHAGVAFKQKLLAWLTQKGYVVEDLGSQDETAQDDYTDFAFAVAQKVVKSKGRAKGILLCGTGTGMAIAANKVTGARAASCHDVYTATMSRRDNDANILALQCRNVSYSQLPKITTVWLQEPFLKEARFVRRITKIKKKEQEQRAL